jgi:hypothetical protein
LSGWSLHGIATLVGGTDLSAVGEGDDGVDTSTRGGT